MSSSSSSSRRTTLRATFDVAAASYQQARPEYPAALFDDLVSLCDISPSSHLLEIGPATGKATLPLARRGATITCVELGASLAAVCRANLAAFPRVAVINADVESWAPSYASRFDSARFDVVFAATAFHWLDPATRYATAATLLRPGGYFAFWDTEHVFPDGGDGFFQNIQPVYEEIGEKQVLAWPRPGELADSSSEILACGFFESVTVRRHDWESVHTVDSYIELLDTFSGHIAMSPAQRGRLYGAVRALVAARPDGLLRRHNESVLHIARTARARR